MVETKPRQSIGAAEREKRKVDCLKYGLRFPLVYQVSCARSGRNWLASVIQKAARRPTTQIELCSAPYERYAYIMWHAIKNETSFLEKHHQYIFLIRDPRDVLLSHVYFTLARRKVRNINERHIKEQLPFIERWKDYFQRMLPLHPHILQYESLCLQPEYEISEVLKFLNITPKRSIPSVVREYDQEIMNPFAIEGDERSRSRRYTTRQQRYDDHCLKWKKSDIFVKQFSDYVWKHNKNLMQQWGYTYEGHDISKIVHRTHRHESNVIP